jgi:hypothetical protein
MAKTLPDVPRLHFTWRHELQMARHLFVDQAALRIVLKQSYCLTRGENECLFEATEPVTSFLSLVSVHLREDCTFMWVARAAKDVVAVGRPDELEQALPL